MADSAKNCCVRARDSCLSPFAGTSAVLCLVLTVGCASGGRSPISFSVQEVREAAWETVFADAEAQLVEMGYSIARRDPSAGILRTHPIRLASGDPVTADRPGSRRRPSRQVVTIQVVGDSSGTRIYCNVSVQQRTTAAYRVVALDYGTEDVPNDTPIERSGGGTPQQNTVWQTTRRDRRLERQLITSIVDRAGRHPAEDAETPADQTPTPSGPSPSEG